ncbi:hypothetical protein M501DRAFT_83200 [Patellaria atrata CBS 101060]|uniref:Uncharacterized protein n=1 Tax=Patellaria atrata CBS 101060 TaxID=1346257 RepID=A0A9P4VTP3_9PEZI|nr:hypothetical protein M501DRAFT_83200 [Patellaria atrata CBS 101060]
MQLPWTCNYSFEKIRQLKLGIELNAGYYYAQGRLLPVFSSLTHLHCVSNVRDVDVFLGIHFTSSPTHILHTIELRNFRVGSRNLSRVIAKCSGLNALILDGIYVSTIPGEADLRKLKSVIMSHTSLERLVYIVDSNITSWQDDYFGFLYSLRNLKSLDLDGDTIVKGFLSIYRRDALLDIPHFLESLTVKER